MAKTKSKAKLKHSSNHEGSHRDKHAPDAIGDPIKSAFKSHTWPASRKTLIAHARQNGWFSKAELAQLEKIPDRRYKSVVDLTNTFKALAPVGGGQTAYDVGEVATVRENQMAQGSLRAEELDPRPENARRNKASHI